MAAAGYVGVLLVALYMVLYVLMALVHGVIYITRSRNLFIASRCPDMLLVDLLMNLPVVLANGGNLISQAQGRPFPCWIMKLAAASFSFNPHVITVLRSMKLLWAFDKRWAWVNAIAITARRRLLVIVIGYLLSGLLFALTYRFGACRSDWCMTSQCPWASDYNSVWPLGLIFVPVLESLGYALGKAGADSEVLGMKAEVQRGNHAVAVCMLPAVLMNICMDFNWLLNRRTFRKVPCILALVMTAVHFAITHLMPAYYLGYGPDSLASLYETIGSLFTRRTSPEAPAPALQKAASARSRVMPLPPQAATPPSTPGGVKPPTTAADGGGVGARRFKTSEPSEFIADGEEQSTTNPLHAMNVLAPDAMATFMSVVLQDESRKQQLLDRARDFLSEDGMRFALSLTVIKGQSTATDNRKHILKLCEALVQAHFGAKAEYSIDLSPAAANRALHEVTKLARRKVLFEDDVIIAIVAFDQAMAEVDFRLRQIAWDFVQESQENGSESERPRGLRRSHSSTSLAGRGGKNSELPSNGRLLMATTVGQAPGQVLMHEDEQPCLSLGGEKGDGEAGKASRGQPPGTRKSLRRPSPLSPSSDLQPTAQPDAGGTAEASPRARTVTEGNHVQQASLAFEAPMPSLPASPRARPSLHLSSNSQDEQLPPNDTGLARSLPSPRMASQADEPQHPRAAHRLQLAPLDGGPKPTESPWSESTHQTPLRPQLSLRERLPSPRSPSFPRRVAPDPTEPSTPTFNF